MPRFLFQFFKGLPTAKVAKPEVRKLRIEEVAKPGISSLATELASPELFHKIFPLPKHRAETSGEGSGEIQTSRKLRRAVSSPEASYFALLYPPAREFLITLDNLEITKIKDLRPYQLEGVDFLYQRNSALLADEMGLGKTAQALFALEILFRNDQVRRALVICPASVMHHWHLQARKWIGREGNIVRAERVERESIWRYLPGLLICTPQIVQRDARTLTATEFDIVICDDVKPLRNENKTSRAIRDIKRRYSWCLTGTPMATNVSNLLNVLEFIRPGLFSRIEMLNPPSSRVVEGRKAPYYLRRTQEECLAKGDIPELETIIEEPILESAQRQAYDLLERNEWDELIAQGHLITKLHIFTKINKLIRLCTYDEKSDSSAKANALEEELEEIFDSGDKGVVIFSYMTAVLDYLNRRFAHWKPIILDGRVNVHRRHDVIANQFVRDRGKILLMQARITEGIDGLQHRANYVFHFDRQWDPTEQDQGTGRVKRPSEHGPISEHVFEYVYVTQNTIEERIHLRLQERRAMIHDYVRSTHGEIGKLSDTELLKQFSVEDLIDLLNPDRKPMNSNLFND